MNFLFRLVSEKVGESVSGTRRSSLTHRLTHSLTYLAAALALLVTATAHARINVVTLPDRDSVQLTIYNSADLTLVKETRNLTLRKGMNRLEFSWANTLIDPTSVEFRALTHADEVEVADVSFPPRVTNTLEWRINSEFAGDVVVEIRYFTSGLSWSADYVAEAVKDEKLIDFSGAVRANNNSGEDYENAQVRLVVGVIRLVEDIANLARAGKPGTPTTVAAMSAAAPAAAPRRQLNEAFVAMDAAEKSMAARPKEIIREGVSEYFMYTVEGRDTILNGWSKRMPSFRAEKVPITSYYKFEKERFGDQVIRYYQFTNSVANKLGNEPLPDGAMKAFRFVSDDLLYAFVGSTSVKYIPVNEFVELDLGNDQEVSVKPTMMDWQKTDISFDTKGNVIGWTEKQTWQFEVQNSKDIPVVLDIRRNFSGDWSLTTAAKYDKVDATKVKFVVPLKPREKQTLGYEVMMKHGTNKTK
ncbi:MAG TPA: DUF4139 domain-containing protein [Candidatus Acidoferrum sp.]|nr:DUF4139 domain-containing protein [Candidatus Acidoferrum sp.]